ncbi:protein NRT1/ PTR FAMILY 5.2-like [Oryza brachyantha]|uniref:protein NRT1/ PTR FAMILY 5.2-like n=1 Tax=Oryza brachyantha TaxID=4533 RepID=UPI001ADC629D|nr:protein NRT1/ PTR FAMILY 5.2-like [Oryza brachyantha]
MENGAGGEEEYTRDGSVDLRGNPVLRSRRGGWRACSFIVVYELFERMAYYGIASNLVIYLTEKLHQGTVEAANNVTNWSGTVFITPLIGAVVADAYLGRYWTFVAGSAVYLMGMLLLTLAVSVPALKPPACDGVAVGAACPRASALQLGVYFGGLYIIALGHGGTKPNISTIGADQFDDFHPPEKLQKLSFFNWWMFTIFLGILFSTTVLVYLQDNVSWTVGYGIPTLGLMISVVVFLAGTPLYRHKVPQGSPLATMGRVIAAAVWKCRVPVPADSKELHELELEHYTSRRGFRMDTTSSMAFLNKAAVKSAAGGSAARLPGWTLCTVTQVEETKQIVKLVPLLATMVVPCTLVAQAGTLFVKQGVTLDRHIGKFHVPPASLGAFVTASMLVCIVLYDRFLVPAVRRRTKNPRGITLLQRISLGMLLQIVTMVVTSVVESQRLSYARRHGLVATGGQLPLTIFILLPQFVLMGVADAFLVVGQIEFFYDQAPESMKSLGTAMSLTAYGAGNLLSSAILTLVERVTGEKGAPWVTNNLNASRLDYYYAFLGTLGAVNLLAFVVLSCKYSYRVESTETIDVAMAEVQARRG